MTDEDPIEKIIGRFGKYQLWIFFLITLGHYPTDFQLLNVVFILPEVKYVCADPEAFNLTNHCPCTSPNYDESDLVTSVTSEFNLICDRKYLASLTQSMLHVGFLIGSLIFGYISDRFGRKVAVTISIFSGSLISTISAFAPNYWVFMVTRLMMGIAVGGTMMCCYVLLVEICGKSFRPYLVALHDTSFVTGYLILPVISYFIREWRVLQTAISAPWLLTIVYYWLLPESPRWLITVGRKKEAIQVLTHIAKMNDRPIDNIAIIVDQFLEKETENQKKQYGSYFDLFRTPKIRLLSVLNAVVWLCCAHVYYGINQYVGHIQGSLHVNVIIAAVCLLPVPTITAIVALKVKRKSAAIATFAATTLSLIVFLIVPSNMKAVILTFAIIGQMAAYASFLLIFLRSAELFPTVVRNSAMGFASTTARVGSLIAPFVVNVDTESISVLIFTAFALTATTVSCFLPETKDIVLVNSIAETERRQK